MTNASLLSGSVGCHGPYSRSSLQQVFFPVHPGRSPGSWDGGGAGGAHLNQDGLAAAIRTLGEHDGEGASVAVALALGEGLPAVRRETLALPETPTEPSGAGHARQFEISVEINTISR